LRRIAYITFNDPPSGVYKSQVVDVLYHLNHYKEDIILISFISFRNFLNHRKKIKNWYSQSFVIPMVPGVKNWKWNYALFFLIVKLFNIKSVIARGVFANHLAIKLREKKHISKVVFDSRGAYAAEWREFDFGVSENFINEVLKLEQKAVLASDFRISVSNALIKYWEKEFQYEGKRHEDYEIIPCTLSSQFLNINFNDTQIRKELNIPEQAIVIVYSGSTSGWQSIDSWIDHLEKLTENNSNIYVLFLTNKNKRVEDLCRKSTQIKQVFVSPEMVPKYLSIADYGLLIRDENTTNKVSSPVKFAEYLSCGLDVIISKGIGDYTFFIEINNCGMVLQSYSNLKTAVLSKKTIPEKQINRDLALKYFTKEAFEKEYLKLLFKLKV
jgi:hypothetical protein